MHARLGRSWVLAGLVDLTLVKDVTDARENLMKRHVRSTTLSPGASIFGFVYNPGSDRRASEEDTFAGAANQRAKQ